MILPVAFLALTFVLGYGLSVRLPLLKAGSERIAVGSGIAVALQCWLPFATAGFPGAGIRYGPAVAIGAAALLVFITRPWRSFLSRSGAGLGEERTSWQLSQRWPAFAFAAAISGIVGWFFYTHSLRPTEAGLTSAGVSWEDQAGHAMYASSFLYSENLSALQNPTLEGWPLAYPFLSNFLAAALVKLGASLSQAFWLSGWYACMSFILLLWVLVRDWISSPRSSRVVVILFLCAGGFGFFDFFDALTPSLSWTQALMQHDYANAWELNLHYHNPFIAILLPMRSFLFGLPLVLSVFFLLQRSLERGLKTAKLELLVAGMLTGAMPLINAHAALITALTASILVIPFLRSIDWRTGFMAAACFGLPTLALAIPQLLWTRSQLAGTNSFIRFEPGWMANTSSFWLWLEYWVHNGGIRLPLGLAAWVIAPTRLKRSTAPFLALLLIGNLWVFQPLVYDNVKLFLFADIALSALVVAALETFWRRHVFFKWATVPLVVMMTASGLLSMARELRIEWVVVDPDGIQFAELVREHSPPRAVFLTGSELTHPVPVLTGRPLVLGYHGWLGNLGIPLGSRSEEVRELFAGGATAETTLQKYHVDFVVIGPAERREFPILNEAFFSSRAKQTWRSGPYVLYQL